MEALERTDLPDFRRSMRALGMVVAQVDRELRYVWVDNPHPDFDPQAVVGKRDDELAEPGDAQRLMDFKRAILASGRPSSRTMAFRRSDGLRTYAMFGYPLRDARGRIEGVVTVGFDLPPPAGQRT